MNLKILGILFVAVLAALCLLAPTSTDPKEASRLNNLGCAYMNQQLFEKALKSFQQAEAADSKLVIARLNEGVALENLQKVDDAKAALEDALKRDSKLANAWYNLGLLAKNSGDADESIADFKRVTEIDSNDADTWYFLGTAYLQAKQFAQAIDAFDHALKINPLHASAQFGLSRAYQQSGDTSEAREHLKRFQYITQNKYGTPMSLAYGDQGRYSRAVESPQSQLKPPPQIKVQFVDVTKEAGLTTKSDGAQATNAVSFLGPGACFLDYDNDGNIDVLLPNGGSLGGITLYHNIGGTFEDVTKSAGLDPSAHALSCTTGDYDNDGFADIALVFPNKVLLFHNEKNGTFKDITESAGIQISPGEPVFNIGAAFVDYDHDGDLDLYVTQYSDSPWDDPRPGHLGQPNPPVPEHKFNVMWRNNGNGSFTEVSGEIGLAGGVPSIAAIGTDSNNDRAVDLALTGWYKAAPVFRNPREGRFRETWHTEAVPTFGMTALDSAHDGWMGIALTGLNGSVSLWRNDHGKYFEAVKLPETNWVRAYGVAAFDYDNDGWVDLVAVGETKDGKGEIKLFRNLGPDGFKDVTADVGLDKIHLEQPRAIITGDYDNDGAVDLLITQNHGPAVLLKNEGGNQNHWLRLALKGLADNKSAIGTKVEVFAGGNRQKFEIYGSNGYLGQNSPYLTVGLGQSTEADVVRMLWPTGVLQDEINVAGDKQQDFLEIDRRGSSCPTLFVWDGKQYQFVADMLGAGVVGHWVGPGRRDIPRPVEWIKIDRSMIREKVLPYSSETPCHPERSEGAMHFSADCKDYAPQKAAAQDDTMLKNTNATLSFRFMEPLEEAVYLDRVRLLAVDHPADVDVYPNEYFASNPPYPKFKVVLSRHARPPAAAWDDHGRNVLPDLLAHRYVDDFGLTQFVGFAKPHTLTLNLGEAYEGGPLWLLMHGEIEYFSANSMYAASQAGITAIPPYVEALVQNGNDANGRWKRVVDDMGFPAGGPRTMTADLTGKLPEGTRKIRITTNLQIYWDSILIDRTPQPSNFGEKAGSSTRAKTALARNDRTEKESQPSAGPRYPERSPALSKKLPGGAKDLAWSAATPYRLTLVPLQHADLEFHGYPYKIEGTPTGNVNYIYEQASATGPYTRPTGTYTRYGDVLALLTATDDKLAVFGSGDEVRLDFDASNLPTLPVGWVRDYFFAANGYEKDMDFYAADGNYVSPLPFLSMGEYPYGPPQSFPMDDDHLKYLLEYNTRFMSGNEQRGYWFNYGPRK